MKSNTSMVLVLLACLFANSAFAATDAVSNGMEETPQQQSLERVESVVYGAPSSGGMFLRLARVERDLFGMELPGSLTERQQALLSFVEEGTATQPSLVYKVGVAEWVTLNRVNPAYPLADRMSNLELALEGEPQIGALSARLERILTKLLPNGIYTAPVQIPAGTVFKGAFTKTLTVRNVAAGDKIELSITEDFVSGGVVAVAKGNRILAEVTKVRMPRSFGRTSEINVDFKNIESLDGRVSPVTLGPQAKKAMELDAGTVGAAGASIAGAVLLGPLGLAGGFLVRGSDKQIKEGTLMYVETTEAVTVTGYPIAASTAPAGGETYMESSPQQASDFVPIDGASGPPAGEGSF
jgi:hypothetical protein